MGKQNVWSEQVLEREALVVSVVGPQDHQGRSWLPRRPRLDDRLEEITKPEPAPLETTLRPGRYAMEVRDLIDTRQLPEFVTHD
jgi:hypothetical protein